MCLEGSNRLAFSGLYAHPLCPKDGEGNTGKPLHCPRTRRVLTQPQLFLSFHHHALQSIIIILVSPHGPTIYGFPLGHGESKPYCIPQEIAPPRAISCAYSTRTLNRRVLPEIAVGSGNGSGKIHREIRNRHATLSSFRRGKFSPFPPSPLSVLCPDGHPLPFPPPSPFPYQIFLRQFERKNHKAA